MKKLLLCLLLLLLPTLAFANQKFSGTCQQSGKVLLSGLSSSNNAGLDFASATVTVAVVGGGLASIFSDNAGTPLANPFTAGTDATFGFYAANGRYSVSCSGTGIPTITVNSDALLNDSAVTGPFIATSFSSTSTPIATTGVFRLASTDLGLCWRNNANSADLCLTKSTGDVLSWPGAFSLGANPFTAATFISNNGNVSSTGTIRFTATDTIKARNFTNSADLNLLSKNASDIVQVGDTAGVALIGPLTGTSAALTGPISATNLPASVPGIGTCINQFVRALNTVSAPTCATVGSADLAASLALVTPNIGAATGTSLATTGNQTTNASDVLQTSGGALPATITNDTVGGINVTANGGKTWEFSIGGSLSSPTGSGVQFNGATSGLVILGVASTVGGSFNMLLPGISDTLVSRTSTDTLTNHRITPRIVTLTTSTTFTPDSDNSDQTVMNMTGTSGTITIAAPTGTPTDGQKLILRLKTTNIQTYSFNATYAFSTTVTAPTATTATKTDYIGLIWDATNTKWDVVAVDQGH